MVAPAVAPSSLLTREHVDAFASLLGTGRGGGAAAARQEEKPLLNHRGMADQLRDLISVAERANTSNFRAAIFPPAGLPGDAPRLDGLARRASELDPRSFDACYEAVRAELPRQYIENKLVRRALLWITAHTVFSYASDAARPSDDSLDALSHPWEMLTWATPPA